MTEEERERTMDFILEQQAQSAAGMQRFEERMRKFDEGMQRLEEADARAIKRLDKLELTLVRMAVQFRRERKDLRERMSALVDAQIRSEDKAVGWQDRLARIEALTERNSDAIRRNSEDIRRNSEDIRALTNYVARDGWKRDGEANES
jgi:predicted  nucleic acid-binding Zn-ribbon protein